VANYFWKIFDFKIRRPLQPYLRTWPVVPLPLLDGFASHRPPDFVGEKSRFSRGGKIVDENSPVKKREVFPHVPVSEIPG